MFWLFQQYAELIQIDPKLVPNSTQTPTELTSNFHQSQPLWDIGVNTCEIQTKGGRKPFRTNFLAHTRETIIELIVPPLWHKLLWASCDDQKYLHSKLIWMLMIMFLICLFGAMRQNICLVFRIFVQDEQDTHQFPRPLKGALDRRQSKNLNCQP